MDFFVKVFLNNIFQIISYMKKMDQKAKNKKLSPSAKGTKNFKKMSQLLNAKNFSQKTETPFVLVVCREFLDILGFDEIINDNVGGIKISGQFLLQHLQEVSF